MWSAIDDTTCLPSLIGLWSPISMIWLFQETAVIAAEFHTCQRQNERGGQHLQLALAFALRRNHVLFFRPAYLMKILG